VLFIDSDLLYRGAFQAGLTVNVKYCLSSNKISVVTNSCFGDIGGIIGLFWCFIFLFVFLHCVYLTL
jgi:hypothetical protein